MPQFIIEQPGINPFTFNLAKHETRFGRADDNDCVLVADEVSRYHALVYFRGGDTVLKDLKSLNGTYVNRQRIVERVLSDDDEVWLGSKCRVLFRDDSAAAKAQRQKEEDSKLVKGINAIRREMESVSQNISMIASPATATRMHDTPTSALSHVEMEKMSRAFRRLDALYQATKLLAGDFDLKKRMEQVLDLAIEVTVAERGFLIIRAEQSEEIESTVARAMGSELRESSPSMGIARQAAVDGEPVLMADSGADQQFGARESIIRLQIRSAMCVPMQIEDRILGALYVDTSKPAVRFTEEDLELFQALGNQAAMALENVRLHERMVAEEKKRANLGRFLSPTVVEVIMNSSKDLELGGQMKPVTTLFCDIRAFTPLAERLPPEDLIGLLNEHFTAMTEIVFRYNGTLDKFVGDEVMALFGAPFSVGNDPDQAVRAALAMQNRNTELNRGRALNNKPELHIGIGIDTGEVVAGLIGSLDRMDFTVLGYHANTANRLCSVARSGEIIVGRATYQAIEDNFSGESIGTPVLKGKAVSVEAFRILGLKTATAAPAS
ncbi:MAG: adenylate/guanylate cyclase domain-containing protein [Candidatus Hydrogenedentales bacterium]